MRDNVSPTPNSVTEPLRKHHFSKSYSRPGPQRRTGGVIYTKPSKELAEAIVVPPPVSQKRKFWIVPDRANVADTQISAADTMERSRDRDEDQTASQVPSSPATLPAYNNQAVALQLAPEQPFIVPVETASQRNITNCDASALAEMKFSEASSRWLESCKPHLREHTFYMYGHHASMVNRYFSEMTLNKIHVGHISDYQKARLENRGNTWKNPAGPSLINHEMSVVQQVLKRARLWAPLADIYVPLPLPAQTRKKVLDEAEEQHLFKVAASRPEWELAYLAAKLTRNTTAAGSELRHLRFADVILDSSNPKIVINPATAKNQFRGRVIPLNATAKATIEHCMGRAKKLGSHLPEHYLFPKRLVRGLWDPYKPASTSWLRVSFKGMREAAGFPWLTPHCFRHMAITVMLEQGAAPETVRHIAGHVSEQMMKHYSHNRHAAQMAVLQAMDSMPVPTKKKSSAVKTQQQRFMSRGRRRLVMRRPMA
jgi:integrase